MKNKKKKAQRAVIKFLFWALGLPLFIYLAILYVFCGYKKQVIVDDFMSKMAKAVDEIIESAPKT